MNYRYVFDLDNTLIMTDELNNISYNYALAQVGMQAIETDGRVTRSTILAVYSDLTISQINEIVTLKQRHFIENISRTYPNANLISVLKSKRPKDCILWTRAENIRVSALLTHYSIEHEFIHIFYSNKQDIENDIGKICDILNCKPESLLFFEDDEKIADRLKAANVQVASQDMIFYK